MGNVDEICIGGCIMQVVCIQCKGNLSCDLSDLWKCLAIKVLNLTAVLMQYIIYRLNIECDVPNS